MVEGPLAVRTHRLSAARAGETALQILTAPLLAARLAGGFVRPATAGDLQPVAKAVLEDLPLSELAPLAGMPGARRALLRTLDRLWRAGVDLSGHASQHRRLGELQTIEREVRRRLPVGVLTPPDLISAAMARLALAPRLLGPVQFALAAPPPPVWRPLLDALGRPGAQPESPVRGPQDREVLACATPDHEALEALRWARSLIVSGQAHPSQIAIATASPAAWDEAMSALAGSAGFPLHFSHGAPALGAPDGQACAALCELLGRGLSVDRVRRWLAYAAGRAPAVSDLAPAPLRGIEAGAALTSLAQWRRALADARERRGDGQDVAAQLSPALELLSGGWGAAEAAGAALLPRSAAKLWDRLLGAAPPTAAPFALAAERLADGRDPGACVVWAPAAHLAAAPRPYVWLLGLNARSWPRANVQDPLLPDHIFALPRELSPPQAEADRQSFSQIIAQAQSLRLSFSSRTREGATRLPSPLIPRDTPVRRLARTDLPRHALSEADRLQARPLEAADDPLLRPAMACHRARHAESLTPYDGVIRADHPLVLQALSEPQSARSLRHLLRDPQRYLWRYALGWTAPSFGEQPLGLDDRAFGDLVHQLLQAAVDGLEPRPGFTRASRDELEAALLAAVETTRRDWPLRRPTPPMVLWRHTLEEAARVAFRALTFDASFLPGTRSWTEVVFGAAAGAAGEAGPWPSEEAPLLPGTKVRLIGRIDRLELTQDERAARVSDYKTGAKPPRLEGAALQGGAEMQRIVYAAAVRHHRPDARIVARLVYLAAEPAEAFELKGEALESAFEAAARMVTAGMESLRAGAALPGPDAEDRHNPYRIARPATRDATQARKRLALGRALAGLSPVWSQR